ncbi:MAG: DUF4280 domain-containing protein [Verrucomicrobia bacterium]|nr:DUF4280 domain-containing protein [Verrucomicrobiota bacterium]
MGELTSEDTSFSCPFCTSKLQLKVTSSSTTGGTKKIANKTNFMFPPPGGQCTVIPSAPVPCVPSVKVLDPGQGIVELDGVTALGAGCKFLCAKGGLISVSSPGQSTAKHDEAFPIGELLFDIVTLLPWLRPLKFLKGLKILSKLSKFRKGAKALSEAEKLAAAKQAAKSSWTKSSLKRGQQEHAAYKLAERNADPANIHKEFYLKGSGKRIDCFDSKNGIVYELKPNNPRAIKAGQKQLEGYIKELKGMEEYKGMDIKGVLDTY